MPRGFFVFGSLGRLGDDYTDEYKYFCAGTAVILAVCFAQRAYILLAFYTSIFFTASIS